MTSSRARGRRQPCFSRSEWRACAGNLVRCPRQALKPWPSKRRCAKFRGVHYAPVGTGALARPRTSTARSCLWSQQLWICSSRRLRPSRKFAIRLQHGQILPDQCIPLFHAGKASQRIFRRVHRVSSNFSTVLVATFSRVSDARSKCTRPALGRDPAIAERHVGHVPIRSSPCGARKYPPAGCVITYGLAGSLKNVYNT